MKTIKIIANYERDAERVRGAFAKQTQDGCHWNDLRLTTDQDADFYVVLNCPPGKRKRWGTIADCLEYFDPSRTVVFQMEPASSIRLFPPPFDAPHEHRDRFLYVHDTRSHHNNIEWWVSHCYEELDKGLVQIRKDRDLSAILSANFALPGHRRRVNFANHLSNQMPFDLFTRDRKFWALINRRNVRFQKAEKKDAGLYRYRYHFAAENTAERNYFTEKIVDPILAECLCFYWGCPNLGEFIDPRAFIPIDLDDFEKARATIHQAISDNQWEKRLPYIRAAKKKILNTLQFFPTLERILTTAAA